MNQDNFKDRKALVVGLGKSGKAAMQALSKLGAKVWVQDSKPEEDMEPQLLAFMEDRGIKDSLAEILKIPKIMICLY